MILLLDFVDDFNVGQIVCDKSECIFQAQSIRSKKQALFDLKWKSEISKLGNATTCENCFMYVKYASAHRCSGCKAKQYCSKSCLDEDWEKSHKRLCSFLKKDKIRRKRYKNVKEKRERNERDHREWLSSKSFENC